MGAMNRFRRGGEHARVERSVHLTDEALVGLVARGDQEALAELYDRHGALAYGVARRILRDPQLAEDAVQEGFVNVWRGAGGFRPDRSRAASWILMLVHRRAVDIVRREERRSAESLDAAGEPGPAMETAGGDTADAVIGRLEHEWARATLAKLPDPQREVLELAFYGGYTQTELAERLGVPLGTIKSRMFNGMARLRELMEGGQWPTAISAS
jgi:RNA polymerase sigma-70 factor (ECF subfamily)